MRGRPGHLPEVVRAGRLWTDVSTALGVTANVELHLFGTMGQEMGLSCLRLARERSTQLRSTSHIRSL